MKKVFFLDIDDCLIETSALGREELNALQSALEREGIGKAEDIRDEFSASFHRLYDHHQGKPLPPAELGKLNSYYARLKTLEREIIREYGQVKKWSREVFLYIAAEKNGLRLAPPQIERVTVSLWKSITDHNPFYPDAEKFLTGLIGSHNPFYLISASDCRLVYDGRKDLFTYDPARSKKLKLMRLEKLITLGVPEENIFIGDPYDQPDPWVFRQALAKAQKDNPGGFTSTMAGDSINNDLVPANTAGIENLILVNRHKKKVENNSGLKIREIASFSEITL